MKIQTVPISPATSNGNDTEVVMLKVSGPVDPDAAVMRRARQFVLDTGSKSMIDSFDWAVDRNAFVTEE
jgi:hypothetical protein